MEKISENNCVHSLGYHIVWCTKYRHSVLCNEIAIEVKNIIAQACSEYNWIVHSIEVMPDHIHVFVQADHKTAPFEISKTLKSISAIYIFTKFPSLKGKRFWGSGLWSRGTFYSTVGSVSEEAIKRYIENQKSHHNS